MTAALINDWLTGNGTPSPNATWEAGRRKPDDATQFDRRLESRDRTARETDLTRSSDRSMGLIPERSATGHHAAAWVSACP